MATHNLSLFVAQSILIRYKIVATHNLSLFVILTSCTPNGYIKQPNNVKSTDDCIENAVTDVDKRKASIKCLNDASDDVAITTFILLNHKNILNKQELFDYLKYTLMDTNRTVLVKSVLISYIVDYIEFVDSEYLNMLYDKWRTDDELMVLLIGVAYLIDAYFAFGMYKDIVNSNSVDDLKSRAILFMPLCNHDGAYDILISILCENKSMSLRFDAAVLLGKYYSEKEDVYKKRCIADDYTESGLILGKYMNASVELMTQVVKIAHDKDGHLRSLMRNQLRLIDLMRIKDKSYSNRFIMGENRIGN